MTPARTVQQKIGDWSMAFEAIRVELTNAKTRELLLPVSASSDPALIRVATDVAKMVSANDRMAALVAGMLVGSGIKPVIIEDEGEP